MRFPTVMIALVAAVGGSVLLGILSGFGTGKLFLFAGTVFVLSQLTYVGAIAVMAVAHRSRKSGAMPSVRGADTTRLSQGNDT